MEDPSMKYFSLPENTMILCVRYIAHVNLLVCVPARARAIARVAGNRMVTYSKIIVSKVRLINSLNFLYIFLSL